MIGLLVTVAILAPIISVCVDYQVYQRLKKWLGT